MPIMNQKMFGPHRLKSIWANHMTISTFSTPDNEEFFCLGGSDTQPMHLAVSKSGVQAQKKDISDTLVDECFVLIRKKYNVRDVG